MDNQNRNTMTTKERIIRESISAAEKERSEIIELLEASPLIEIIEGRKKAQKLLCEYETSDPRLSEEIGKLAKDEARLFAIAKKQADSNALVIRRVELDFEISDLERELYFIEREKTATQ